MLYLLKYHLPQNASTDRRSLKHETQFQIEHDSFGFGMLLYPGLYRISGHILQKEPRVLPSIASPLLASLPPLRVDQTSKGQTNSSRPRSRLS